MEDLLSLPIFWSEERLLKFWVDLFECLTQTQSSQYQNAYINLLNSKRNEEQLNIQGGFNMVNEVPADLKRYLQLIQQIKHPNKHKNTSNTSENVFKLLQAIRNTTSHKFGIRLKKASLEQKQELSDLQFKLRALLVCGEAKFWQQIFPELSLITYEVGYRLSEDLLVGPEFQNLYFPLKSSVFIREIAGKFRRKTSGIPENLDKFTVKFWNQIQAEMSSFKTRLWKFSCKISDVNILFLDIPQRSNIYLPARELLSLCWSQDQIITPKTLQICRRLVPVSEEASCLFNKTQSKSFSQEFYSLTNATKLEYKYSSGHAHVTEFPLVCFTNVISSALVICTESLPVYKCQQFVIFTNQPVALIRDNVEQFFAAREIPFFSYNICWNELSKVYQEDLRKQPFPLHQGSNKSIKLNDVLNSSSFNEHLPHGVLISLMHEKTGLVKTNIPNQRNTIPRMVYLGNKPISFSSSSKFLAEKELVEEILRNEISHSCLRNIYFLHGIAGIGKSTFLSKLGGLLVAENKLVIYTTCKSVLEHLQGEVHDLIKILWHSNELERLVVAHLLKEKNTSLWLLFDGFHELNKIEKKSFLREFIQKNVFESKIASTTIFLAGRTESLLADKEILADTLLIKNSYCLKYVEVPLLSKQTQVSFIKNIWQRFNKCVSDDIRLSRLADGIIDSTNEFCDLARTPRFCSILGELYEDLAGDPDKRGYLSDVEVCSRYHDKYVQNEFVKNVQKPGITPDMKIDINTIDTNSFIYTAFKENVEFNLGQRSFDLCFNHATMLSPHRSQLSPVNLRNQNSFEYDVDLMNFINTPMQDYYCALQVFRKLQKDHELSGDSSFDSIFRKELFAFKNAERTSFQHASILVFFNALLNKNILKQVVIKTTPDDLGDILPHLLSCKLYYVFLQIVDSLHYKGFSPSFWHKCRHQVNVHLDSIFKIIANHCFFNATKFLVDEVKLDITGSSVLHFVLENKPRNDQQGKYYELLKYLLVKNADINAKNGKNQTVLTALCLKTGIDFRAFECFVEFGSYMKIKKDWRLFLNKIKSSEYGHYSKKLQKLWNDRQNNRA